jgi:hypothetical protein
MADDRLIQRLEEQLRDAHAANAARERKLALAVYCVRDLGSSRLVTSERRGARRRDEPLSIAR